MLHYYYYSSENIEIKCNINRHFTLVYLLGVTRLTQTREWKKNRLYMSEDSPDSHMKLFFSLKDNLALLAHSLSYFNLLMSNDLSFALVSLKSWKFIFTLIECCSNQILNYQCSVMTRTNPQRNTQLELLFKWIISLLK